MGKEIGTQITLEDIKIFRNEVKVLMAEVSEPHGFRHAENVATFARYIALSDGNVDPSLAEVTGLGHDIQWEIGEERVARDIKVELIGERLNAKPSVFISDLYKSGKISATQAGEMMRAVVHHGIRPDKMRASFPLWKVIGDADRLTRFGYGFVDVLKYNREFGFPFWTGNFVIVKPEDSPVMRFSDQKSGITALNFLLDWVNHPDRFMRTNSGRDLAIKISKVNRKFLEVFQAYVGEHTGDQNNIVDEYKPWIGWLEELIDQTNPHRELAKKNLAAGDHEGFKQQTIEAADSTLLTLKSFNNHLARIDLG